MANTASGDGGAVFGDDADVVAEDCLFVGNEAGGDGGALAVTGTLTLAAPWLEFHVAGGDGGALWADGTITVTEAFFLDDFADGDGGGAWLGGTAELAGITVLDGGAAGDGGGLFVAHGSLDATDLRVEGTSAGSGGALFVGDSAVASIDQASFEDVAAVVVGGAGAIATGATLELSDVSVSGSFAEAGGALHAEVGSAMDLRQVVISGTTAAAHGGGLLAFETQGVAEDLVIENGSATADGALAYFTGGSWSFTDSSFRDGSSGGAGALFLHQGAAVVLDECAVVRNTSVTGAGVVLGDGASLQSVATDWGVGADDNVPADVAVDGSTWSWDGVADFLCETVCL